MTEMVEKPWKKPRTLNGFASPKAGLAEVMVTHLVRFETPFPGTSNNPKTNPRHDPKLGAARLYARPPVNHPERP